jgi:hypothetical protein
VSLDVATANIDFARRHNKAYLEYLCKVAQVLFLQEAKNVNIAEVLPEGWTSLQDTSSEDRAGACIAVLDSAVDVRDHRLILGAKPFIGGHRIGMLPRWIEEADLTEKSTGHRFVGVSAHEPPMRFRLLQPGYTKRLATVAASHPRIVIGTDANQRIEVLGDRLGLDAYGRGIVGILTDLTVTDERVRPWGEVHHATDHPAVTARIHIPAHKEKP